MAEVFLTDSLWTPSQPHTEFLARKQQVLGALRCGALSVLLGLLGWLFVASRLMGEAYLVILLAALLLIGRQTTLTTRIVAIFGFFGSLNLGVARDLFEPYNLEPLALAGMYALVVLYSLLFSGWLTGLWPRHGVFTLLSVMRVASGLVTFEVLASYSNIWGNFSSPFLQTYYLYHPQLARLYGVLGMYGVAWTVLCLLLGLVLIFQNPQHRALRFVGLFALIAGCGLLSTVPTPAIVGHLSTRIVQPGVREVKGETFEARVLRMKRYVMTAVPHLLSSTRLNLLPESTLALFRVGRDEATLHSWPLTLSGGVLEQGGLYYNAAVLVSQGTLLARYHKSYLVPIEEDWIQRGSLQQSSVLSVQSAHLGLSVCYEANFPQHFDRSVAQGAQALVVLSNTQSEHTLALQKRALRIQAAVQGRDLAFVSLPGGSELLSPQGIHGKVLPWGRQAVADITLPLRDAVTLSHRWGGIIQRGIVALWGISTLAGLFGRRRTFDKPTVKSP